MERYKEISLADLLGLIANNKINDVYLQQKNGGLVKAMDYNWKLDELGKYKFFKREVVE
ncbi:hypothetical protein P4V72_29655 [Bacillus thuringiensis]|uniref:hypothetical protein n=1 Tax=Bacillus thuringiensis TaxID=1428 RepID=UPI00193983D1|nr:hypothetical protein [Bacillus thuringiensis]MEB9100875.1 hypothetical protein [Bacillus cereus]MEC3575246.1 hypothetical protein [Bacillus thuringiensis]MED2021725.1 hypothetical protein [Bacillus thuringiensis]MED2145284.1 hypothetical protein [Bacillus thuringiensis]MED2521913.1 hypothetical protein [Bacillus thuringiensis]